MLKCTKLQPNGRLRLEAQPTVKDGSTRKKKAIKCGNGPEGWCDTEGGGGMGNEMKLLCPPFNSVVANSILIMQRFCFDIGRIRHE